MAISDTPRTDEQPKFKIEMTNSGGAWNEGVRASFARTLERELREAWAQRGTLLADGTTLNLNLTPLGQIVDQMEKRALSAEHVLRLISELEYVGNGIYTNAGKVAQQMALNYFSEEMKGNVVGPLKRG